MPRPVTLFTGQWADVSLAELAPLAKEMGYDGLELACWGDHFEVRKALTEDGYVEHQRRILEESGLECYVIGNLEDTAGVVGASVLAAKGVLNVSAGHRDEGGKSVSL